MTRSKESVAINLTQAQIAYLREHDGDLQTNIRAIGLRPNIAARNGGGWRGFSVPRRGNEKSRPSLFKPSCSELQNRRLQHPSALQREGVRSPRECIGNAAKRGGVTLAVESNGHLLRGKYEQVDDRRCNGLLELVRNSIQKRLWGFSSGARLDNRASRDLFADARPDSKWLGTRPQVQKQALCQSRSSGTSDPQRKHEASLSVNAKPRRMQARASARWRSHPSWWWQVLPRMRHHQQTKAKSRPETAPLNTPLRSDAPRSAGHSPVQTDSPVGIAEATRTAAAHGDLCAAFSNNPRRDGDPRLATRSMSAGDFQAPIAQRKERPTSNRQVDGSIPSRSVLRAPWIDMGESPSALRTASVLSAWNAWAKGTNQNGFESHHAIIERGVLKQQAHCGVALAPTHRVGEIRAVQFNGADPESTGTAKQSCRPRRSHARVIKRANNNCQSQQRWRSCTDRFVRLFASDRSLSLKACRRSAYSCRHWGSTPHGSISQSIPRGAAAWRQR